MSHADKLSKAVRFDTYGGVDVLYVAEVPTPTPGAGQVLVNVRAAGINPGEVAIREGVFHERWPATFPSGEGTDFAGVVADVGSGVTGVAVGDEVIGWTDDRASHAEYVVVDAEQLAVKPAEVGWEVAGGLAVVGFTATAAVAAVASTRGEVVVIAGAAGGVGTVAVQLVVATGATVIGLASEANHAWLASLGAIPVTYGPGQRERIEAAAGGGIDAFIDLFGGGYVALAIELGVAPDRINTIIDFAAVEEFGVKSDGQAQAQNGATLGRLASSIATGELVIPVAATYPLTQVREAYRELAKRHTHGKIVLIP
ncbi:putative oxidoreductase [Gordonia polyisoprenivorans NBRC 16320 = JCM 10675]|uniref:NADP-dependent oxidoreductase n=1 Tax=Gordonia polyisoprenivorans TaxID=84595 RepID=A0A846WH05_9ACTN|nr:NADP-dependent oxidoreductase [Gordonia polyisoprenivorans]NKY00914.1 NADP-dependent oxidoreductase [Gordonia polyisoprenivorans]GAB22579.1 putative oxidoreductase [Gordonia polyisoprenivorans NBRC 16320 = JCM 10675]